jgi:preprotein translocase subunit SecD
MFNTPLKNKAVPVIKNITPWWQWLLILCLTLAAFIYALPNIYGESPAIQISNKDGSPITLNLISNIQNTLNENHLTYTSLSSDQNNITLKFTSTDTQLEAEEALKPLLQDNYIMALNLLPDTPAWLRALNANPMKLGLDLRGGMYFLLNIDMQVVLQNHLQNDAEALTNDLRNNNIHYANINVSNDNEIILTFRTTNDLELAKNFIQTNYPDLNIYATGMSLNGTLTPEALKTLQDNAVAQTLEVMRNRVNELGVAEATVAKEDDDRIVVELPGVQDATRAQALIGGTATLKAMLVNDTLDPVQAAKTNIIPPGSSLYYGLSGQPVVLYNNVIITGNAIADANVAFDTQTNLPIVQVTLKGPQVAYFSQVTAENVGHPMAFVLVESNFTQKMLKGRLINTTTTSQTVINVATIQSQLSNRFVITGIGNLRMAQNLALSIRAGALPAPIQIAEEKQVGPSLGIQNIQKGALSVAVALALVITFIALYYRVFGLIADLCLILNLIFIVAVMSLMPGATLSLPGIAGIVLNVGIAIDANVLIFERIREELRKGSSNTGAIHTGYARAFSTILDANVTTFMVALILFVIGTGAIRGFAVTLMIGIVTSMFCAVVISRALVNLIYGKNTNKRLSIGI